jgi:hypothetical protein
MIKFKGVFLFLVVVLSSSIFAGAIYDDGSRVGIGTKYPKNRLHVRGRLGVVTIESVDRAQSPIWINLNDQGGNKGWIGYGGSAGIELDVWNSENGPIRMATNNKERLRIGSNGNVGIGTTTPIPGYKLTVNGGIYALDLRIRPNLNNTADFVFEDDYDLMALDQVKSEIKKNKHLPGIPSAKQMVEEGVSVAEMQAKLLQKIEELTLYMIEQNEKIEAQSKEIQVLKTQINPEKLVLGY